MSSWYRAARTQVKLLLGKSVSKSYSQFGEDMIVKALLRHVKSGVYVDVGAADPVLYSNTYYFYKKGWRGTVIDPNPDLKIRYRLLRPRDTFINAGVGEQRVATYFSFSDETYNTFSKTEADAYLLKDRIKLISNTPIEIKSLSNILRGPTKIDFLNIDVQGLDLEVLQTHNWSIFPTVIAVEDEAFKAESPQDSQVYQFLSQKGYTLKGLAGLTLIFKLG